MQYKTPTSQGPIHATVFMPGAKSLSLRALLLAALADGVSEISGLTLCDDTQAMLTALTTLGVIIQQDLKAESCIVGGVGGHFPRLTATLNCQESGAVARFLLAACAITPGTYPFEGGTALYRRPMKPLLDVLRQLGVTVTPANAAHLPLKLQGVTALPGGDITIDNTQSGQFVSALLMIAPYATSACTIRPLHQVSRPYISMTCDMMRNFGVLVRVLPDGSFMVPAPQRYRAHDYTIAPDFSTASYFFAAAAVTGGQVTIPGLIRTSAAQADSAFLSILAQMGCEVREDESSITVQGPAQLHGVEVDMSDSPDTFMTLAAMAPFANSPTTITGIGHVRVKESDRIAAMASELTKLGIKVETGPDWFKVYPSVPQAALLDSHHDHRIAMACSVLGLRTPDVRIDHAACVSKSCPDFFARWEGMVKS